MESKNQVLQIGEGCDIEMHVTNTGRFYFVSFRMFSSIEGKRTEVKSNGEIVKEGDTIPVRIFNSIDEIYSELGKYMNGKLITI